VNTLGKKQTPVDAVEFIFAECARFMQFLPNDFRSIPRDDLLHTIPDPRGRGSHLICGKVAAQKLEELAERATAQGNLSGKIDKNTIVEPLRYLLVKRFLQERKDVNTKNVDRLLSAAARHARAKCTSVTHFIPCHLTFVEEPNELRFGPVVFRSRRNFRALIAPVMRSYRSEVTLQNDGSRGMLLDVLDYYRAFKWFGEVTIDNCDERTSNRLALDAVTSGLDRIHIIFGAGFTDDMRVGGLKVTKDVRVRLAFSRDKKLMYTWSRTPIGQVNFPIGWSEVLRRDDIERLCRLAGVALETAVNPDLRRPLSQRFIDAIRWYGEAARDASAAAQVVKYVTAIERMLMTEEKDDIATTVAQRASVFCFDAHDTEARSRRFDEVRKLYHLRSRLVHGSKSPFSSDVVDGIYTGATVAREVILMCTSVLGEAGLKDSTQTTRKLSRWFAATCQNIAH
jgi:predicted nuclease of predicted toxin-antitoxin system